LKETTSCEKRVKPSSSSSREEKEEGFPRKNQGIQHES